MGLFDQNAPLRQKEGVLSGAANAVADLAAEPSSTIDSGSPSQTTETAPASATEASRSNVKRVLKTSPSAQPEKKAKTQGDIQVTSTTDEITTAGEDAALAYIQQQEQGFIYGVGAAELQASNSSVAAMQQWGEMNEKLYEGRKLLIEESFPKFRAANEQLSQDIDEARRLKVNPYNYMQSIGRAGRVSSVLAVGLGQLASGAGNPNSVYMRLDASIKRDIAAQKDNIANTWKGIAMKRQLNQDEIALLEQQFNFEDRAMAVGYAAIAARVGAAKQHAKSETIYLNMQMVEERALAASIHAAAQARAKLVTFMMDAKVHSVYGAMKKAEKAEMIRTLRQQQVNQENQYGADAVAAAAQTGGPLTNMAGEVVGPPGAQPTAATGAPAEAAPQPQPGAAPTSRPPGSEVAKDRRKAAKAPQRPAEAADAQPTQPAAQPQGAQEAQAQPEREAQQVDYAVKYGDEPVRKHGSWARAAEAAEGFTPSSATLNEMVRSIKDPNTVDYAIAENINDAIVLSRELPELDPNDPAFTAKDGSRNIIAWKAAQRQHKQLRNHPEAFMREIPNRDFDGKHAPGRNNVLTMPNGDVLHIKADQESLMKDDEKRRELEQEIGKTYQAADDLVTAAQTYQKMGGTSSIMGMRIDSEKGFVFEPASAEHKAAAMGIQRILLRSGIQAIKQLDEAGRLSNEDVGFGKELVATMNEGTNVVVDDLFAMYQQAFGKPGTLSDIRLAAGRVFGAAIKGYLLTLDNKLSPATVMSGEAIHMNQQRANRVNGYIHGAEERFKNQAKEEDRRREVKAKEVEEQGVFGQFVDDMISPNPLSGATAVPRALIRVGKDLYEKVTD